MMHHDAGYDTGSTRASRAPSASRQRPELLATEGPGSQRTQTSPPDGGVSSRFAKGNDRWKRGVIHRHPQDAIEFIDKVVTDALNRVRQREYETVAISVGGKSRMIRKLKRLDAASANAVANLSRLKLDIVSQREAGDEVRRLQQELERMKTALVSIVER